MTTKRKVFDSVVLMRKTRDKLSRRFKNMTFAEQKREMDKLAKCRIQAEAASKKCAS